MRSLKLRFLLLCLGTVLTLGLSHQVARASGGCADIMAGGNYNGSYDCRFDVQCGNTCWYLCTCPEVYPWATCADVLTTAGFTVVEGGPPCGD